MNVFFCDCHPYEHSSQWAANIFIFGHVVLSWWSLCPTMTSLSPGTYSRHWIFSTVSIPRKSSFSFSNKNFQTLFLSSEANKLSSNIFSPRNPRRSFLSKYISFRRFIILYFLWKVLILLLSFRSRLFSSRRSGAQMTWTSSILIFICSQCKPYNAGARALILGDAAHAMVPFYAQGMNAVSDL